jgi:deazaflavin-dependent oxidoreductase (nitroreductase family)
MPATPPVPPPGSIRLKLLNGLTKYQTWLYQRSGGRFAGSLKGAPILLLDHVGRKSGQARTTPLLYLADGTDLVIVASRGGSEATPAWWLNLKDHPDTTVTVKRQHRRVHARRATAEEKARLWPQLLEMFPDYGVYQQRTSRDIPVIILSPAQ